MNRGSKDGSDGCINLVFMKPEHLLSGDVPLPPEQRGWQEPPCKEIHRGVMMMMAGVWVRMWLPATGIYPTM